jgi:aspartyl-tRNA(Asn)/glutamyl-tRNA(Gln) amidotransferase subunit C
MDINHIAKLARLGLKDEELNKLEKDLSAILDFVEKLKEVDIEGVEPMTGGTDLFNALREDAAVEKNKEKAGKILDNAPKKQGSYVEVLAVFD